MNNAENKCDFIRELFLYYKPTLSKEKQITLLRDWIETCISSEEYEMASTLEHELTVVIDNPEIPVDSNLKVVKIEEIIEKPLKIIEKTPILPKKPVKITKKRLKNWKFINIWDDSHGFILFNIEFSIKKKYFKLIILNYGVGYAK